MATSLPTNGVASRDDKSTSPSEVGLAAPADRNLQFRCRICGQWKALGARVRHYRSHQTTPDVDAKDQLRDKNTHQPPTGGRAPYVKSRLRKQAPIDDNQPKKERKVSGRQFQCRICGKWLANAWRKAHYQTTHNREQPHDKDPLRDPTTGHTPTGLRKVGPKSRSYTGPDPGSRRDELSTDLSVSKSDSSDETQTDIPDSTVDKSLTSHAPTGLNALEDEVIPENLDPYLTKILREFPAVTGDKVELTWHSAIKHDIDNYTSKTVAMFTECKLDFLRRCDALGAKVKHPMTRLDGELPVFNKLLQRTKLGTAISCSEYAGYRELGHLDHVARTRSYIVCSEAEARGVLEAGIPRIPIVVPAHLRADLARGRLTIERFLRHMRTKSEVRYHRWDRLIDKDTTYIEAVQATGEEAADALWSTEAGVVNYLDLACIKDNPLPDCLVDNWDYGILSKLKDDAYAGKETTATPTDLSSCNTFQILGGAGSFSYPH